MADKKRGVKTFIENRKGWVSFVEIIPTLRTVVRSGKKRRQGNIDEVNRVALGKERMVKE